MSSTNTNIDYLNYWLQVDTNLEIGGTLLPRVYNGEGEYRTTLYAVKNEPVK